MNLVFISQSANGRLHERANALVAALTGTRVMFLCPDTMSGFMTSSPAGRQVRKLMQAMRGMPYVEGSECHALRDTYDLDAVARAIKAEGVELNSYPHPAGPQATSLVVVADPVVIRQLASRFGVAADMAQLFTMVNVELAAR